MNQPKKVLMVAGRMHIGGLEMMLMNFFRNIDRDKVTFDFMLNYEEPGAFDDEIRALGGKIYIMPRLYLKNLFSYIKAVGGFFKEHRGEYDIIHGNLTSAGMIYLTLARIYGIKARIIHAHITSVKPTFKGIIERLMMFPLRFCADYFFACSDTAAQYCFGKRVLKKKNYKKINNGTDAERFKFKEETRNVMRKELNLEDRFVISHVGRFELEKNHGFILEVFREIIKKDASAALLLVGNGSLKDQIIRKAQDLGLSGSVIILSYRNDIAELMQASDAFILPSLYEGLPVVGIEAQASGLPGYFADTITKEVDITGLCTFLPLDDAPLWAEKILKGKGNPREDQSDKIRGAGYDIKTQTLWLQKFYQGELSL